MATADHQEVRTTVRCSSSVRLDADRISMQDSWRAGADIDLHASSLAVGAVARQIDRFLSAPRTQTRDALPLRMPLALAAPHPPLGPVARVGPSMIVDLRHLEGPPQV